MKKLSTATITIGFILFAVAGCIEVEDIGYQILLGIVALFGLLLVYLGYYIRKEFCYEEADDYKISNSNANGNDDIDLSWVTYDRSGNERDVDIQ